MKRIGYCTPCHEVGLVSEGVVMVDGDAYCAPCMRKAGIKQEPPVALAPEPNSRATPEQCRRGCGRPSHRGLCKGQAVARPARPVVRLPAPVPILEEPQPVRVAAPVVDVKVEPAKKESRMDKLVAEAVRVEDVPSVVPKRSLIGRLGELWRCLEALPAGEVLKVANRSMPHANATKRSVQRRAKEMGRHVFFLRSETDLYCSFVRFNGSN